MGMRDEITAELAAAFDAEDELGDTVTVFVAARVVPGEYDPETGTSDATLTYGGRGIFSGYKAAEIDGSRILATDTKLLVLKAEVVSLPGVPVAPQIGDLIAGQRAMNVGKDPAGATWTIQLRV